MKIEAQSQVSGVADTTKAIAQSIQSTPADIEGTGLNAVNKSFADFGLRPESVAALNKHGIITPFPIQALTLPIALKRQDIIGQAKTGTGKTLGFALPVLEDVIGPEEPGYQDLPQPGKPQALIVLPTRELAKQVAQEFRQATGKRIVRICEVYGGISFEPQIKQLKRGCEIVVGTPGRLIDLLKQRHLVLSLVRTLVLDEADEMLDLGFFPDVEVLLARTPANRQTMLFSATMPGEITTLARKYMVQPTHIRAIDPHDSSATVNTVRQVIYRCHALNKIEVLSRILQAKDRGLTIIFTQTKRTASSLYSDLSKRGFSVAALHGDLGQAAREQALRAFRKQKVDVLVATDVAARGIDVDDVTHVLNYQCPEDAKTYVHRIGRTGRAGQTGTAVTFVDWDDVPRWRIINKELNLQKPEPVETYHTSAHLYTDLEIPEDAGPRLPRALRVREGLATEKIEDLGGRSSGFARRGGKKRGQRRSHQRSTDSATATKPRRQRSRTRKSDKKAP